jgi:carboxylesterase type B
MPQWKPYDQKNRYTMLFKAESELVSDYHKEGRELVSALKGNLPGFGRREKE